LPGEGKPLGFEDARDETLQLQRRNNAGYFQQGDPVRLGRLHQRGGNQPVRHARDEGDGADGDARKPFDIGVPGPLVKEIEADSVGDEQAIGAEEGRRIQELGRRGVADGRCQALRRGGGVQPDLERVLRQQILDPHHALPVRRRRHKRQVCKQHTCLQS
jgi:hypothetical protein